MGWTAYHVDKPINRKTECDKQNTWDEPNTSCRVLKSSMVGSVWYGACEFTDKRIDKSRIFGCVCLTYVDNKNYCNFGIKEIDETMGPCYYECPISVLDLLTPTDNSEAGTWRKQCREHVKAKNQKRYFLKNLPIGSVIKFNLNGKEVEARKCAPAYQFKYPWWSTGDLTYIKATHIPDDYYILEDGQK